MAIKYYDLDELKALALKNANVIDSKYTIKDVEHAYAYASARCGYENPESTDSDYPLKQQWLIRMMSLYFYYDKLRENSSKFDVEGLKLGQVVRNLRERIIDPEEQAFAKAREDSSTAHLFVDATDHFGTLAYDSGIQDDAVGRDYRE